MTKYDLEKIVNYIVGQALRAINDNTEEKDLPVDYLGIFSKDENEFIDLEKLVSTLICEAFRICTNVLTR